MTKDDLTTRRAFLKKAGIGVLSLSAFQFGCDLSRLVKGPDRKGVILYGTRYGSTKETAFWIAEGMGKGVDAVNIEAADFGAIKSSYDFYVLGSGVWIDGVHRDMKKFLETESRYIDGKVTAAFVVCGSRGDTASGRERIEGYLNQINGRLKHPPLLSRSFGGRLIVEQLNPEDREALIKFYRTYLHKELESWNYMDKDQTVLFGKEAAGQSALTLEKK